MPSACNTLPSPDDPSLNAPVILAKAPRDIEADLNAETEHVPDPAALTNPDAIALAAHGLEWLGRAQRIEDCGDYAQVQHCDQGHPLHTLIHRCQGNFTDCCAEEHAKKTVKRLASVIETFTEFHGSRHISLELAIPLTRNRAAIESTLNRIRDDIRRFKLDTFHENLLEPNWIMCLGFLGDSLIVRILIQDLDSKGSSTISTDTWRQLWPEWKVSVSVAKNPTFRSAFNHLLKALPLKFAADRMQQEVLFTDMQRFRASRFKLQFMSADNRHVEKEIENPPDLCVEHPTHDSPAEANSNHPKGKSCPACPICGHPADRFSGMMRVHSRQMMEYLASLRGIVLPHSPPS